MLPRASALALALASTLAVGCAAEEGYTPIGGEENSDELCEQSNLDLREVNSVALELGDTGSADYTGSLEVTQFSRTQMSVDTDEIILSVPGGSIATFEIDEGNFDLFTSMVFAVDIRKPGETQWQDMSLTTNLYDIFWFTDVEFNGNTSDAAISTLRLCSTIGAEQGGIDIPYDLSEDYEVRLRPFPFEGFGDLVGRYDYTIHAHIQ
jgi:hypothetical protein